MRTGQEAPAQRASRYLPIAGPRQLRAGFRGMNLERFTVGCAHTRTLAHTDLAVAR